MQNLFKIFEDSLLDLFVPHLEKLVNDTQEHNQRCASELISGIIQGSKHWSFEQVERLWTILLPILRTAFTNITDETIVDWGIAIAMSVEYRDPNRHHWLLEFLMDNPLSEPTSFIGCARIYMLQNALNQQPWRNAELINRLLEYFKDYLSHPFQNVREKISACLVSLFCKDIVFPEGSVTNCPRVADFFGQILPKLNMLYMHSLKSFEHVNDISDIDLARKQLESVTLNEADKEECIRLFKTSKCFEIFLYFLIRKLLLTCDFIIKIKIHHKFKTCIFSIKICDRECCSNELFCCIRALQSLTVSLYITK